MAKLEFEFIGIDQNFRSSASNVLKDIDKIKSAFRDVGQGVSGDALKAVLGAQKVALAEAKVEAVKLAQAHKNELATALNDSKKGFIDAKTAIQEYNLEQKKLKDTQRTNSQGAYSNLSKELNQMRNEAKNLGAQMILLDSAGMKTSSTYNTLENRFNQVQKETLSLDNSIKKLDSDLGQNNRRVGAYGNALGGLQQKQSGANGVAMEFNRIVQDAPFGMMGIGNNIQQLAANWQHYATQQRTATDGTKIAVSNMTLLKGAMASILSPANLLTLGIAAVTSAWTYYSMNTKTVKESTQELSNSFVSQLGTLNLLINSLDKGTKTQRDKATAVSMYNKELGDTLGKVKTYAELENKLIKNAPNYIQYLSLKARAEGAYQLSLEKTKKLLNDNISLSENKRVSGMQGWLVKNIQNPMDNFFDNAFKSIGAPDLSGLRTNDITPEEALAIAGLPSQKDFDKAIKYFSSSIQHGLVEMRKQNKTLKTTDDLFSDLTKKANEYADTLGLKMPDLNLDKEKNLPTIFDYLSKIKDLLGDKRKDLDMFGLKGEQKELKELEYSFKDFFSELDKLSSKLAKDDNISKSLKSSIQGRIENAKNIGDDLKKLQGEEISNKWLEERTKLIDEMYSKVEDVSISGLDKALSNWSKEVDKFKESIISSGVPLAQFQATIDDLIEKGSLKIKVDFAIQHLEEIDKLEKQIQDLVNKPFSSKNKDGLIKQTEERKKEVQALYDVLVQVMKLGYDGKGTGGFKLSEEDIQKTADSLKLQIEANAKKQKEDRRLEKDIQDYVTIANNGLNSVFTNLKANIDEFGWKARSVFYTLGESLGDLIKQLANKNTAKFMESITKDAKSWADIKTNFNDMWKNNKSQAISAGLGYAGGMVQSFGGSAGDIIGGGLSGASAGLSAGVAIGGSAGGPWGAAIGAVVGMTAGILKQAKNRRQEKILIKQMEEQKKANRLLERMSALTYASQIIGQKTEYGIVSGMKRNEYGQIVSVVQGQDIIMVADRANKQKQR